MTKAKKYDFRLVQKNNDWSAEITRRATSEKTVVSKRQGGFASEAEAQEWATKEVASFIENHHKKDKERSEQRKLAKLEQSLLEGRDEAEAPVKTKEKKKVKSQWEMIKKPAKKA